MIPRKENNEESIHLQKNNGWCQGEKILEREMYPGGTLIKI
jgi:hypothetical protein